MLRYNKTAFIVYGLYLVHVFAGNLITSVHAVYLLSKGITYFQLNSLTSIVLFVGILLEVPTGIIGDRFGHKVSFQLSMFLSALRRACIPFVTSFDALVILAVVSAISDACWSGSFTAWYMASLKVKGTDAENVNLFSNLNIVASIAGIAAGFIGGYIGVYSIPMNYYISCVLGILCVVVLFFIKDYERQNQKNNLSGEDNKKKTNTVRQIIKTSVAFFAQSKKQVYLIIAGMFIGYIVISGIDDLWQPLLLKKENSTTVILGIAWTMIRSGTLLSAVISKKLSPYRKYYRLFKFALILLSSASLFAMAYTKSWLVGAFCFSLHALVWVTFSALNNGILYSFIPDKAKATILSTISMIYSLAGIIGLSIFGFIADINLPLAFAVAAISMCAILFTVFIDKDYEKNKLLKKDYI